MTPASPLHYRVALLLATLSGAAALIHETLWARRLVDILGAADLSTGRVLGGFFFGLSVGAAVCARVVGRIRAPWRALAGLELGIALLSVPALLLPSWTEWLWPWLGPAALAGATGAAVKWIVSLLVVVPPAFLMGFTLPVLARAGLDERQRLSRQGVWLYAINTFGGLLGLVFVGLVGLPVLGNYGSMAVAAGLNVVVAAAAVVTPRVAHSVEHGARRAAAAGRIARLDVPIVVAFVSGFGILAMEMLTAQLAQRVVSLSHYGVIGTLGVTVLLLAAGAAAVPAMKRRWTDGSTLLPALLLTAGVLAAATPWWFFHVSGGLQPLARSDTLAAFLGRVALLLGAGMGPCLLAAAPVFPTVFDDAPGRSREQWLARLLAANGLGGLVGAEVALAGLSRLGTQSAFCVVGGLYVVVAGWVGTRDGRRATGLRAWIPTTAALAIVGLAVVRVPNIWPERGYTVLDEYSGPDGYVAVVDAGPAGRAIHMNNQYLLGNTAAALEERRQVQLPLLLHPNPRRVAVIGLATGITPGAALRHPAVERLDVVELSAAVVRASREHFGAETLGLHDDGRATIVVEDGRTYLAAAVDEFDVVIGDLFLTWRAGVSRLYSREHFEGVRRSLVPGGVYAQWLPAFQLTEPEMDAIVRTFVAVFGPTFVFRNNFSTSAPTLVLVATRDEPLDFWAIGERVRAGGTTPTFADPLLRHPEGVGMMLAGMVDGAVLEPGPTNTLDDAFVELSAGRARVLTGGRSRYLTGARWARFDAGLPRPDPHALPDAIARGHALGRQIMSVPREQPSRTELAVYHGSITSQLPPSMVADLEREPRAFVTLTRLIRAFSRAAGG